MQVLLKHQKFYFSNRLVVTILLSDEQERRTNSMREQHAHAHTNDSNKHLIKDELSTILLRHDIVLVRNHG